MSLETIIAAGTIVGEIEVTKPFETTDSYECAAWYRTRESATGRFPVTIEYPKESPPVLSVELPGVVTGSNFTSRLGASYGPPKVDEDKGESVPFNRVFPLSEAFTGFNMALFEEFVEPIAKSVIDTLNAEVAEHVAFMAKRVPSLGKTIDWMTAEPSTGMYSEWATGSFFSYGTWVAEKSKILERMYSPCPTDRLKSIEAVIEKWKKTFAARPAQWDRNRAFEERCSGAC